MYSAAQTSGFQEVANHFSMPVSLDPIQIDNSTTITIVNGSNGESDLCFFYWKVIWCIVDVHTQLTNNNNNKRHTVWFMTFTNSSLSMLRILTILLPTQSFLLV